MANSFIEMCIYEVKPEKTDEFEKLILEVAEYYKTLPGVLDIRYMRRTHRQEDFNSAKNGEPPIRLKRAVKSVNYSMYWELENEVFHGQATKLGLEAYYKRFTRCLTTMPKIILGERIV